MLVAAAGNGEMWITQGREARVQPGDFLISSDVPGCAMADDPARFELGYVVARAASPVDWSLVDADDRGIRRESFRAL